MNNIDVRRASHEDVEILSRFIHLSAAEQDGLEEVVVTPENLSVDGFGPSPLFSALIAECEGTPAGFALYFPNYSTWMSRRGVYLEDLYVAAEYRRRGVARALMTRLAGIALELGGGRINWLVLRENTAATAFYRSLGAEMGHEWMPARLAGAELTALTAGNPTATADVKSRQSTE